MREIEKLAEALKKSPAVVFTGAGVSTNSGIPDFRGTEGFYKKYHEEDLAIESFFNKTDYFYTAFQEKFSNVFKAKPNDTHRILADLEQKGYINGIITQNVDRLHQQAGSKNVIEFHGNIYLYSLIDVTSKKLMNYRIIEEDIPYEHIVTDGQIKYRQGRYLYKPQVVLFGEGITEWGPSVEMSNQVKVHIIMGTSFLVSPFNMISYENREPDLEVFVINNEPINYYGTCTQIIGDTSNILKELMELLR